MDPSGPNLAHWPIETHQCHCRDVLRTDEIGPGVTIRDVAGGFKRIKLWGSSQVDLVEVDWDVRSDVV
jgi:hypothetical protein